MNLSTFPTRRSIGVPGNNQTVQRLRRNVKEAMIRPETPLWMPVESRVAKRGSWLRRALITFGLIILMFVGVQFGYGVLPHSAPPPIVPMASSDQNQPLMLVQSNPQLGLTTPEAVHK